MVLTVLLQRRARLHLQNNTQCLRVLKLNVCSQQVGLFRNNYNKELAVQIVLPTLWSLESPYLLKIVADEALLPLYVLENYTRILNSLLN